MTKYVEYVPCALVSITDQKDGWFEARATYQGSKPLTLLINAPSERVAETYINQNNASNRQTGELLQKPPTDIIDSFSPISLADLAAKLTQGTNYGGVISTENGRSASVSPLTPGMRNFLQRSAQPRPAPAA